MKFSLSLIVTLCLTLQQFGCSTVPAGGRSAPLTTLMQPAPPTPAATENTDFLPTAEETSPHPSQFSKDVLYNLLVAEVAGQRGKLDILVENYTAVAKQTQDTGVTKRAVNAAQYAKKNKSLTELALLWSKLEADSVDAHQLAAFQLIKHKDYSRALILMERVLELGGPTTFDRLALHARNLEDKEKAKLLNLYYTILERHPDNEEILYSYAVLQELNGKYQEALASTDRLLAQTDSNPAVIALRSRLIKQLDGLDESLAYLQTEHEKHPEDMQTGTLYGRTLIEARQFDQAEALYKELLETFPGTPHLKLSYSLIALENKNVAIAKEHLMQLVTEGHHLNEVNFYLGQIADQEEHITDAIFHYQQVNGGSRYFTALRRSSYLLIKEGRLDEAAISFSNARQSQPEKANQIWMLEINLMVEMENFSRALELSTIALEEDPEAADLRYARAMIRDSQGMPTEMEEDLRYILKTDPDNSVALNALGYTLADRTDRLDEAFKLISRAIELDPDSPAILDSMGWVLYRLDKLPDALEFLQKAYSTFPDAEIAAHLGEVLWMLNQQDKAISIWKKAHEKQPDHQVLSKTLERLSIEF